MFKGSQYLEEVMKHLANQLCHSSTFTLQDLMWQCFRLQSALQLLEESASPVSTPKKHCAESASWQLQSKKRCKLTRSCRTVLRSLPFNNSFFCYAVDKWNVMQSDLNISEWDLHWHWQNCQIWNYIYRFSMVFPHLLTKLQEVFSIWEPAAAVASSGKGTKAWMIYLFDLYDSTIEKVFMQLLRSQALPAYYIVLLLSLPPEFDEPTYVNVI